MTITIKYGLATLPEHCLLSSKKQFLGKHMCLAGFKCWKHTANVAFLCKPDLPRSVPLAEVALETVSLCFSYKTYICTRTEHDAGMPRLAEMIRTATFFSETFTGISLLEIRLSQCLESPNRALTRSLLWEPEKGRKHGETCIHTFPETTLHRHLHVFYTYSITYVNL